ncbi:MAG: holin [Clostridia bacterium]|nr:phage holin family protein [Candidatus Pelethousia sp.]NCB29852.1 holin [Clostridia bacterium]
MNGFKSVVAVIGGIAAYLWGAWDALIQVLVAVVVIDYVTGVIKAAVKGELSSGVGFKGLAKKVAIFLIVALGVLVDTAIPATNGAVRSAVIMFYVANEGLSILENIGQLGVPLPVVLKGWLAKLKEEGGEDIKE